MTPDDDLQRQISDLRGNDPRRRDKVLRQLYESPVVAAKVNEWIRQYANGKILPADIIQEGILILYRNVRDGTFRGESRLTTFLLSTCHFLIRNGGRNKRNRSTDSLDAPESPDLPLQAEESATDIERNEDEQRLQLRNRLLREVLASLSDNCRSALALYYTQNKNTKEIAAAKDYANPGQAKKLLYRCREKLRKLIGEDPDLNNFLKMTR